MTVTTYGLPESYGYGITDATLTGTQSMSPILGGALIGGVASTLGGILQNRSARKAASKQRAWSERMANTQYQRATADLEAAGLNRILALGKPAPTPSTAAAPVVNTLGKGVQSALAIKQAEAQIAAANSQANLNNAGAAKTRAETFRVDTDRRLGEANILGVTSATGLREAERKLKEMLLQTQQDNPWLMLAQQTPIQNYTGAAATAIGVVATFAGAFGIGKAWRIARQMKMFKNIKSFREFRNMIKQVERFNP